MQLKGDSVSARYNYVRQPLLCKKPAGELDTNTCHRTKVSDWNKAPFLWDAQTCLNL